MTDAKLSFPAITRRAPLPHILRRLAETNLLQTPGYGLDSFSQSAREKLRKACAAPEARVHLFYRRAL